MSDESDLRQRVDELVNEVRMLRWTVLVGGGVLVLILCLLVWPIAAGALLFIAAVVFIGLVLYPCVASLWAGLRGSVKETKTSERSNSE
jgi:hypothetical protein